MPSCKFALWPTHLEGGIFHGGAAVFDDDGLALEPLQVRQRLRQHLHPLEGRKFVQLRGAPSDGQPRRLKCSVIPDMTRREFREPGVSPSSELYTDHLLAERRKTAFQ